MFNEAQEKAIDWGEGPALILAGPGSGKTTVITHRIKRLIESGKVNPENILVVTFTNAAAHEMQQRFLSLMQQEEGMKNGSCSSVVFGTFHSIFYRIIRLSNGNVNCRILSENEKNDILKEIIIRMKIETSGMFEFIKHISGEISRIKGNRINPEEYHPAVCNRETFIKIFKAYDRELLVNNRIDFDDMLIKCSEILKNDETVRNMWQEKFKYILVDEMQDINDIQYENIKILAAPHNNIFVVGDDDQSIYGFRGSNPEIMFRFKEDFKECREILLNINYRCTDKILNLSLNLIQHNQVRFDKSIQAVNFTQNMPEIKQFQTQFDEMCHITKKVKNYIAKGIDPENMAILVRNNSQISRVREILTENGIISNSKKTAGIYETMVGKDIIAYVKCSFLSAKTVLSRNEDFARIVNKPARFISRQILWDENVDFEALERIYGHSAEIMQNIRELKFHFSMIHDMSPMAAVIYIRNGCGYEKYLKQYVQQKNTKIEYLISMLDKIQADAIRFKTLAEWISYTEQGLAEVAQAGQNYGINIVTMHGSKGLEYDVVFIPDANQGLMPSANAIRQNEIEEERRIFYVAMTRAKKFLHVYSIRQNMGNIMEISQFVGEALQFDGEFGKVGL